MDPKASRTDSAASLRSLRDGAGSMTGASMHRAESALSEKSQIPGREVALDGEQRASKNSARMAAIAGAVTDGGKKLVARVQRTVRRTRRRIPLLDFILTYSLPQVSAGLFLADIITDVLVVQQFFRQHYRAVGRCKGAGRSDCRVFTNELVFAYASLALVVVPLCLTAFFLTRSQRKNYIDRRMVDECQKQMQSSDPIFELSLGTGGPGPAGPLGQQDLNDGASGPVSRQNQNLGALGNIPDIQSTFTVNANPNGAFRQQVYVPPAQAQQGPLMGRQPSTNTNFNRLNGLASDIGRIDVTHSASPSPSLRQSTGLPQPQMPGRPVGGLSRPLRSGPLGESADAAHSPASVAHPSDVRVSLDLSSPRSSGAEAEACASAHGPPADAGSSQAHGGSLWGGRGVNRSARASAVAEGALRMDQLDMTMTSTWTTTAPPVATFGMSRPLETTYETGALDQAEGGTGVLNPALVSQPAGGAPPPAPTAALGGQIVIPEQDLDPAVRKRVSRESVVCAIFAFPLMLMLAVGFDVALIVVSIYPRVTSFLNMEKVMPAYWAYRTLIEVALEAIPQVFIQLLALIVLKTGSNFVVYFSIGVAILNLGRTLFMLRSEARELDMGLVTYIKYLLEVGSGRLPLRSISDNSIGEVLDFKMNMRSEMVPLRQALKKNKTLRIFTVADLPQNDLVELLSVLEGRKVQYIMEVVNTSFTEDCYVQMLLVLLKNRYAHSISFRRCRADVPSWLHREGFTLMRFHLPGGCLDDGLPLNQEKAVPESAKKSFVDRLLQEWLIYNEICVVSNKVQKGAVNFSSPVSVSMRYAQRQGTFIAVMAFLHEHAVISKLECSYPITPPCFVGIVNLLSKKPEVLASLQLHGLRCTFDQDMMDAFCELLMKATKLRSACLTSLWDDMAGAQRIVEALGSCKELREMVLSGNRMNVHACAKLGSQIRSWEKLYKLGIDGCQIEDGAMDSLVNAATSNNARTSLSGPKLSLKEMHIGGNWLGAAGLKKFATYFASVCPDLRMLDLSCSRLGMLPPDTLLSDSDVAMLSAMDHSETRVRSRHNMIVEAGGPTRVPEGQAPRSMLVWDRAMVDAVVPVLRYVHKIRVHGCAFAPAAMGEVLQALGMNNSLTVFGLRLNESVQAENGSGAVPLADVLKRLVVRAGTAGVDGQLEGLELAGLSLGSIVALESGGRLVQRVAQLKLETCLPQRPDLGERGSERGSERGVNMSERGSMRGTLQAMNQRPGSSASVLDQTDFQLLFNLLPGAQKLQHLEIICPGLFSCRGPLFQAASATFKRLSALVIQGLNIAEGNLLNLLGASRDHPLAQLELLNFTNCNIGDQNAAHLGQMLMHMHKLRVLKLVRCGIEKQGLQWMLGHWTDHWTARSKVTLIELDLSGNHFGHEGAKELGQRITTGLLTLRKLRLSDCKLGSKGTEAIAAGVKEAINELPLDRSKAFTLQELYMDNNDIGELGSEAIANIMQYMPELEVFAYHGNRPAFEGVHALMSALQELPCLQVVSMGTIASGMGKGPIVGSRLPQEPLMQRDSGGMNMLGAALDAAGAAIRVNSDQEAGSLSWEGAGMLFQGARHMNSLRELRVQGLGGSLTGAVLDTTLYHLSLVVRGVPALQVLDLQGIGLWGRMVTELMDACEQSSSLEVLDVRYATLGPAAYEELDARRPSTRYQLLMDTYDD